jgi:transcription termination/antitermination protein NusG
MSEQHRIWYVVKTYSGYEHKVKKNLEHRTKSLNAGDWVFRIELPPRTPDPGTESESRPPLLRSEFGYVLVETSEDAEAWYIVRNTPGVLGLEKLDLSK